MIFQGGPDPLSSPLNLRMYPKNNLHILLKRLKHMVIRRYRPGSFFHAFQLSAEINFFQKFFQECHQSVKQFGSRSGPDLDPNCQRMTLVGKELIRFFLMHGNCFRTGASLSFCLNCCLMSQSRFTQPCWDASLG